MSPEIFSGRSYSVLPAKIQDIENQKQVTSILPDRISDPENMQFLLFYISKLWITEYIKYVEQHYMILLNIFRHINLFIENHLGAISGILYILPML